MATVSALYPLMAYQASSPVDINGQGRVVGNSFDPKSGYWVPPSRATLWKPLYGGLMASPLYKSPPQQWLSTEAIGINASNQVLCVEHASGGVDNYYLWKNEAEPALDLSAEIEALDYAVALNDNEQLLVVHKSASPQPLIHVHIHDLTGGQETALPSVPYKSTLQFHPPELVGMDNDGRVAVWWPSKSFPSPWSIIGYWDPDDPSEWSELTEINPWFKPVLTKTGLILATSFSDGRAHYYNLEDSPPKAVAIPEVSGWSEKPVDFHLDASTEGWMVGGSGSGGTDYKPILYKQGPNKTTALHLWTYGLAWTPLYGVGIAGKRIICEGLKSAQSSVARGWIADLSTAPSAPFKKEIGPGWPGDWDWLMPEMDLPDVPPIEVIRPVVEAMSPEEKTRALARVDAFDASAKGLANVLREALQE